LLFDLQHLQPKMIKSLIKVPANFLSKYNTSLLKSPYKTKMATAGFTYFLADCICQDLIEKQEVKDHDRSLRQASVGAFFAAPSLHVWHSKILPRIVKGCTKNYTRVLVSVFLNESVLAGYFISCLLFSFEGLKHMSVEKGVQNVQDKFLPALDRSVKFWTGISFINYGFMPIHLRPVFVSCWSIGWQSYLSYISNNTLTSPVTPLEENEEKEQYDLMLDHPKTFSLLG